MLSRFEEEPIASGPYRSEPLFAACHEIQQRCRIPGAKKDGERKYSEYPV